MMKFEMIGGTKDGAEIETENEVYDFHIPIPVCLARLEEVVVMPKLKVYRYRRISETRMRYEGIVLR